MEEHGPLPTSDFAFDLLRILKVPYHVRKHSIKVAERALEIANLVKKKKIDKNLVEIGALVHDIGRSKTHGFEHALIGGKILKERGLPNQLVRICETHILGGLDREDAKFIGLPEKEYLPMTLEEKIICVADKLTVGTKEVTIEQRFNKWFSKYGKTELLLKSKKRIEEMQKEIESLM